MQLYSVKGVIFLGDGVGTEKRFTDDVFTEDTDQYYTIPIDGAGALERELITQPARYIPAGALGMPGTR